MIKFTTKFVDVPGAKIAYIENGQGKPLIFIHGNSSSKQFFSGAMEQYREQFHTYALDSRGYGETVSNDKELSYEQIADDIIAFCKLMKIDTAYVVGESDGGIIALWLAIKTPRLFLRLVSISPNYKVSALTEPTLKWFKRIEKVYNFLARLGIPIQKNRKQFKMMLIDSGITDDDLRYIQTSILLLYAERDIIKPEHFKKIIELVLGIQAYEIKGTTHMNIMSKPETKRIIWEYLQL